MVRACAAAAASLGIAAVTSALHGAPATAFQVHSYNLNDDGGTAELPGRLYVPSNIPAGEKRPLVMFLHGIDERGSENTAQVNSNINGLYEKAQEHGFYLYAPQLPTTTSEWGASYVDMAMSMVAKATQNHAVDTSRIYVTGISMGGGGTKVAITTHRDTFAAAVPLSGTSPSAAKPAELVGKPIWLFHSQNDSVVNVSQSDNFVNAVRAADGKPALTFPLTTNSPGSPYPYTYTAVEPNTTVNAGYYDENNLRYSRYTAGGHATKEWTKYYRETWLYDWMLDKTNPQHKLQTGEAIYFDLGTTTQASADAQGRTWNSSIAGEEKTPSAVIPFARMAGGTRSAVSLSVIDAFAGTASGGSTSGSLYAANVAQDTWIVSASDPGAILLDGLTPGAAYRLSIFGSGDSDGGLGRMTRYTIGDEFHDLQIAGNLTGTAVFDALIANSLGQIILSVGVTPDSGSRYGGIGAIELTAVPEPAAVALLSSLLPLALRPLRR